MLAAIPMASMAARTAGRFLPARRAVRTAAWIAASFPTGTGSSRTLRFAPCEASRRACAHAALRKSSFTRPSSRPSSSAGAAGTRSPLHTIWIARATPTRRGRCWVPLAPGMIPSVTSGNPTSVRGAASLASHPSASSKPPPKAPPCGAATTGLPHFSGFWLTGRDRGGRLFLTFPYEEAKKKLPVGELFS
jgi:hypothetical protein